MWDISGDLIWQREVLRIKPYYNMCLIRLSRSRKREIMSSLTRLYISRAGAVNRRRLMSRADGSTVRGQGNNRVQAPHKASITSTAITARVHPGANLSILECREFSFWPWNLTIYVWIWYLLAVALGNILISLCFSFSYFQNGDNITDYIIGACVD